MTQATAAPAFANLQTLLDALRTQGAITARATHTDLGEGLWLSCDPEGQAAMVCSPEGEGFRLAMTKGDSGRWASFGMRLPLDMVARGRYLGLLIETFPEATTSFSPSLRYRFHDGGTQDASTPDPVVLPVGLRQTQLIYIPIDSGLLDRAADCELNLFFHENQAELVVTRIEPLLIN